jgi:hypothetical protein
VGKPFQDFFETSAWCIQVFHLSSFGRVRWTLEEEERLEDDFLADTVIPCCSSNLFMRSFLGIQTNFTKASLALVNALMIAVEAVLLSAVAHLTVVKSDAGTKPLRQVSNEIKFWSEPKGAGETVGYLQHGNEFHLVVKDGVIRDGSNNDKRKSLVLSKIVIRNGL